MTAPPSDLLRYRRTVERALSVLTYPVDAIFERAGFSRRIGEEGLNVGDGYVEGAEVSTYEFSTRLWLAARAVTGDDAVEFCTGMAVPFGRYAVIDYLTGSCATLGEAMTMLAQYFSVISPHIRWTIQQSEGIVVVGVKASHPDGESQDGFLAFTLGVTFSRFRELVVAPLEFVRVEIELPKPRNQRPYTDVFGPVTFDAPTTALHFSSEAWAAPLRPRGVELHEVFRRQADEKLAASTDTSIAVRGRVAIRRSLPKGSPKLGDIAKQLGVSERTLQRRLREANVSFQALVDSERLATAKECLKDSALTVADVAYLVGYSEPSAFVRAFKRWTGHSPSALRD